MRELINHLRLMLRPRDKWKLIVIVGMMVSSAFLEILGIGLLMPLVAMLTKPELFEQNFYLHRIRDIFGGLDSGHFLVVIAGAVILVFAVKNVWMLWIVRCSARFLYSRSAEIGGRIYGNFLRAPYSLFMEKGAVELNLVLQWVDNATSQVLLPFMQIVADAIVAGMVIGVLLFFMPGTTLFCALILLAGSCAFYFPLKGRLKRISAEALQVNIRMGKRNFYSFEDIKNVKIATAEDFFVRHYRTDRERLARFQEKLYTLGQIPRMTLETIAIFAVMILFSIMLLTGTPNGTILLCFSMLIAAMSRLLPAASRINYSLTTIRQGLPIFLRVAEALRVEAEHRLPDDGSKLSFADSIVADRIVFGYRAKKKIFDGFSFRLKKNESLAVTGPTGSGKSTLAGILLGLLNPEQGTVMVDGKDILRHLPAWRRLIGYVPQHISLADDTIAANIAVGVEPADYDFDRIRHVLVMAQLAQFVDSLPDGLETMLGENGMRLSGGQRQRLGIARALYRNPEVLILDEATSALDNDTENALIEALETLHGKLTIIMIAHRLSTVEKCDRRIVIGGDARC